MRISERITRGLLGAAALALVATSVGPASAQAPAPKAPTAANPWVTLAPFPQGAEEVLGATANGKFYVFCGLGPGWKPLAMVYEYDPAANAWTQKKPMALPSHHVAFASLNGKIYAFGGFVLPESGPPAWVPINNAWEYDPAADSWKALAPMPTKRGAAAAAVANGKIYVVGGANTLPGTDQVGIHPARPMNVVATVEEYDPATNSWRERRPMLVARNHHAVASVGDKIYAIGGRIGSAFISNGSNNIDLVEMYDPATDMWVVCATRCRRGAAPSGPASTTARSSCQAASSRTGASSRPSARSRCMTRRSTAGRSCRRCRIRVTASQAA